jgi:cell wall-associated NlpC family hydrolase
MTVTDAVGRIGEIQSALQQLQTGAARTQGDSATAATFAQALALGLGGTGLGGTGLGGGLGGTDAASLLARLAGLSGATGAGQSTTSGVTGADVVADATKYLGVPYVFGGESTSGMDCSGLVQRVFADLGVSVPRVVTDQMSVGTAVPSMAQAKPGDLIVLDGGEHIVIYAGDGKVIHAPREGKNVSLVDAWFPASEITTIRRVVPAAGTAAPTAASAAPLAAMQSALFSLMAGGGWTGGAS